MRVSCDEYNRLVTELLIEKRLPTETQKDTVSAHRKHCHDPAHNDAFSKLAALISEAVEIEKTPEPVKVKRCVLCQQVCLHDEDEWMTEGQLTRRLQHDPAGKRGDLIEVGTREYCKMCSKKYNVETTFDSSGKQPHIP